MIYMFGGPPHAVLRWALFKEHLDAKSDTRTASRTGRARSATIPIMCNLYSSSRSQDKIRRTFAVDRDEAGNLPPLPGIFPDQMAPVVHTAGGERALTMMRWGFPPPPKVGTQPVTNVRNVASPYWRPWLKPAHRCLVPVTSFSEYADTKPRKTRCGSPSMRAGRCSPSRGSGGLGPVCVGRSATNP